MKIRNGFVSNSSSSSFAVFGHPINLTDINSQLIKDKKIYGQAHGYEGIDFIPMNQQMFDLYMIYGSDLEFYYVDAMIEDFGKISKDSIQGDDIEVSIMEIDHYSVKEGDLEEFSSRYLDIPPIKSSEELKEEEKQIENLQLMMEENGLEAYVNNNGETKIRKKK